MKTKNARAKQRAGTVTLSYELSQKELEMAAECMELCEHQPEKDDPAFKTAAYKLRRMADAHQVVQFSRLAHNHGSSSEVAPIANAETPITQKTGANARQVGGQHYKTRIEHWDFAAANDMDYFQGQITKYVTRWKKKKGVEDLEKALHFLQKYMELIQQGVIQQKEEQSK